MNRPALGLALLGLEACEASQPVQIDPTACVASYQEGPESENTAVTLTPDGDNLPVPRGNGESGDLAGFAFPVTARSQEGYDAALDAQELLNDRLLAVAYRGNLEAVDPTEILGAYLSTRNIAPEQWPDFGDASLSVDVDATENTGENVWAPMQGEVIDVSFLHDCRTVVPDINDNLSTPFVVTLDDAGAVTIAYVN